MRAISLGIGRLLATIGLTLQSDRTHGVGCVGATLRTAPGELKAAQRVYEARRGERCAQEENPRVAER